MTIQLTREELELAADGLYSAFFDRYDGGQNYRELADKITVALGGGALQGWGKPYEEDEDDDM